MSKFFLTSGTGYIGLAVARAAKEAGHDVTALARSDESAAVLEEHGITVHRGDLKKPETYCDIIKKYDAVMHTAAVSGADFPEVDKATVEAIIEGLRGSNKAFIYTSGVWVIGNTGEKLVNEESAINPIPLVAWRPAIEQRVLKSSKDGIRSIVLRPGVVYGHGGGIIGTIYANAKKHGEARYIGDGENRWSLVHVDDLGRLYVLAAEKAAAGLLLHGTDGKPVKQREIVEWVATAAGIPGKVKSQTVEEALKDWGVYAYGLAINQNVASPNAKHVAGWEPNQPNLEEDLAQNVKEFASPCK